MDKDDFKYYAFISYDGKDIKWANRLQKKLENYKLPSFIRKKEKNVPKQIRPIFRDKTDLLPGILPENIQEALSESKFLILVCSPNSAKQKPNDESRFGGEIRYFEFLGRKKNIIPFIIKGIPNSNDEKTECYHYELKKDEEYNGKDIHERGQGCKFNKRERAYLFLIARILGLKFDTLYRRHKRRKRKKIILNSFIATIFIVFAGFSIYKYSTKDIRISLKEQPPINSSLPFPKKGAMMYMSYGEKTDSIIINSINQKIIFKEIHGKFIDKISRIKLDIYGFHKIDTSIYLTQNIAIPIKRDSIYGYVYGYVKNSKSGKRESGIQIEILNYKTITDDNGEFKLNIPIEEQRKDYILTLKRKNKVIQKEIVYPLSEVLIELK